VMRPFWERLREVREVRSFMFFTPTSVIPPPHSSNVCSFLKSAFQLTKQNMVSLLGLQYRTLLGTRNRKLLLSPQHEGGLEKDEERPPAKLDLKTNKKCLSVSSRTMRSIHKTSGQQNKDLQDERRMNPNETL
jgi:hypothetical protein